MTFSITAPPHRQLRLSPFQYPGGKTKLLLHLLPLLTDGEPLSFSDVFTGGGSVALAVADALPNCRIVMNDLHPNVAAFWRVVVDGREIPAMQDWIMRVNPSKDLYRYLRKEPHITDLSRACIALYLNRCSHNGAMAGSRGGREPHDSRWYPERHCEQIEQCHELLRGRTEVWQVPFWHLPWAERVYLDPPYVKKGAGLYVLGDWCDEHEMLPSNSSGARDGFSVTTSIRTSASCSTGRLSMRCR